MRAGKLSIAGAVIALLAALAIAPVASADRKARTTVSIKTWPRGVFGYVDSPRAKRCAAGRQVRVFKQRGSKPHPGRDVRIASATAKRNHGYQWSVKTRRTAGLYARTARAAGCRVARSGTVTGARGDVPNCPSKEDVCRFPNMHVDLLEIRPCPSFTAESGNCSGTSEGGVSPWSPENSVSFYWNQGERTQARGVSYQSYYSPDDEHAKIKAQLQGSVPGPGSANFSIRDASALGSDEHWYTPDIAGQGPGEQGGPLYLDFENGSWGADVYIRGYLYRK